MGREEEGRREVGRVGLPKTQNHNQAYKMHTLSSIDSQQNQ